MLVNQRLKIASTTYHGTFFSHNIAGLTLTQAFSESPTADSWRARSIQQRPTNEREPQTTKASAAEETEDADENETECAS